MARVLFISIILGLSHRVAAQDSLDSLTVSVEQTEPLLQFLTNLEQRGQVSFFYIDEWLEPFVITRDVNGLTLKQALRSILEDSDIGFVFLYHYAVIFFKDPARELERDEFVKSAVSKRIKVDNMIIGTQREFIPGNKVILQGIVRDKENNSPLVGTSVSVNDLDIGTNTDGNGRYQLVLPGGEYAISFRFINYQERLVSLSIYASGNLDIDLEETPTTLQEVVVSDQSITTKRVGQTSIKMTDLNRSPSFLGEIDVIKMLQTQTGVTSVSEASTGFNVRGGGVDQNLVLFDGVPIFNTSHALGFFTAFNSDAVKEASFYKGGIPAEYGGRVSSVLNMSSKEGSYSKWGGDVGIGFISSNLTVGGPIKRDTSSLIVSLRSTYSDWLLKLLQTEYQDVQESSVSFYDGSVRYSSKLRNGARLMLSTYWSSDRFRLSNDTINRWQNQAMAVRYDHILKKNLYYSIGLYMGRYSYQVSEDDPPTAFDLNYKVIYPSLKIDFNRDGVHKQTFGFQTNFYNFQPGRLRPTSSESNSNSITMPGENSIESAVYFSDSFYWGDRLNVEAGLRLSLFNRIGKGLVYTYEPGQPLEPRYVMDSVQYEAGEVMQTYGGPEPRLSLRYTLNLQSSIKLGYNRIYQYVHLISNTAAVTPVDIWQSSNKYFRPQVADQVSLGYFRNSKNNKFESYIDVYYKHTENILDFKDGARLILNPKLETALLHGISKSYGAEFSVEKVKGRFVGGINYTYSRSLRKINGDSKTEKINEGNYYPSNYDQPHIVNLNWRLSLTRKVFFSGIFTYHTGRPISLPVAAYEIDEAPIIDFSERNNYRLPDYHRLDLALVIEGSNRKNKLLEGQWTISIYNVYGRKNPYSAFFSYNAGGAVKPYQISLIGVPIPSISYSVKF